MGVPMNKYCAVKEDSNIDFRVSHDERKFRDYYMPQNHYHSEYEIYYLCSGQRYYFIKDRTYLINPGDLIFINSNEIHRTLNTLEMSHSRTIVQFSEAIVSQIQSLLPLDSIASCFIRDYPILHLDPKNRSLIDSLFTRMINDHLENTFDNILQKILLCELLVLSARLFPLQTTPLYQKSSSLHNHVTSIVKYINENYSEDITLVNSATKFYISPSYLSKIFHKTTGFTFTEYINFTRVKQAKVLLEKTDLNIQEISEQTGFTSNTHFGRVFKELTEISPSEYRKNKQNTTK